MKQGNLTLAKNEAKRFLEKIADLEIKIKSSEDKYLLQTGCVETAALKRSSLDLTRVLARLRRENY